MKFKVLFLIYSALALTACGGGSGGEVDDATDNSSSIPNDTIPQIVDEEVIADYEQYFTLEGAPVIHTKMFPDERGRVFNFQLEEFNNNLIIKIKESGTTEVHQKSQSVDLSNYTEVVDFLDDQWVTPCKNFKEVSINSDGTAETIYYSRVIRRVFTPHQNGVQADTQEYSGLNCDRRKVIDDFYFSSLILSTEVIDNAMQVTIGYGLGYGREWDDVTEYTHKILMAKDGNSFIMFEGDKTYTLYNRIPKY